MWTPLSIGLLLVATAQAVALAGLVIERRRFEVLLREMQRDITAALDVGELEQLPDEAPATPRPIGFRAS